MILLYITHCSIHQENNATYQACRSLPRKKRANFYSIVEGTLYLWEL